MLSSRRYAHVMFVDAVRFFFLSQLALLSEDSARDFYSLPLSWSSRRTLIPPVR